MRTAMRALSIDSGSKPGLSCVVENRYPIDPAFSEKYESRMNAGYCPRPSFCCAASCADAQVAIHTMSAPEIARRTFMRGRIVPAPTSERHPQARRRGQRRLQRRRRTKRRPRDDVLAYLAAEVRRVVDIDDRRGAGAADRERLLHTYVDRRREGER